MKTNPILTAQERTETSPARQSNPPRRILVVDGNRDILELNTEVLIRHGFHADAASDGADAWHSLNANKYDLLITDHNMPNMTGFELLKLLHGTLMALPVIMATGSVPRQEFKRYPWLLPSDILIKPYTVAELLGKVTEVLGAPGAAREQLALPSNVIPPDCKQTIYIPNEFDPTDSAGHTVSLWVQSSALRERLVAKLNAYKAGLLEEFRDESVEFLHFLRLAVNEAEGLAWSTSYAHLLLPTLLEEKIQYVLHWASQQHRIRPGPTCAQAIMGETPHGTRKVFMFSF